MPSVCIQYAPAQRPTPERLGQLAETLARLIEQILAADPANVQIMPIELASSSLGPAVYVEIKARSSERRTPAVLEAFVQEVDRATRECFGVACRIRYFSYAAEQIVAVN